MVKGGHIKMYHTTIYTLDKYDYFMTGHHDPKLKLKNTQNVTLGLRLGYLGIKNGFKISVCCCCCKTDGMP